MKKFTIQPPINLKNNLFGDPQNKGIEYIKIGKLAEAGLNKDVFFDISGERVVGIFGKRGSGKSYSLGSIIEGFFCAVKESDISKISRERAGILFDTLNIFWGLDNTIAMEEQNPNLVQQIKNLKSWYINPISLDVTIWIPTGTRTSLTPQDYKEFALDIPSLDSEDWGFLFDLDIYIDPMGQLLNELWNKVVYEGWSMKSSRIKPICNYEISDLLHCLQNDDDIITNYAKETRRALYQRFNSLKNNKIFSSKGTQLNELIKSGHLSVIELNQLDEDLRALLASVLIKKILKARSQAAELEKQLKLNSKLGEQQKLDIQKELKISIPHTWVFIDEAQLLLPSDRKISSTDIIVRFVKEGRNHGLSLAFTTQQPSSIDSRVMSQLDTLIVHKLSVQGDINYIINNLKSNNPSSIKYGLNSYDISEVFRVLDNGQAFISNSETERSFVVEIRPRITVHGGIE